MPRELSGRASAGVARDATCASFWSFAALALGGRPLDSLRTLPAAARIRALEDTLLARRCCRISIVVEARQDAHVVVGEKSKDKIRRYTVAGKTPAGFQRVTTRRALLGVRSRNATEPCRSDEALEVTRPRDLLEQRAAGRHTERFLATEPRIRRVVVRAAIGDLVSNLN